MGHWNLPDTGPQLEYSESMRLRMSDADAADERSRQPAAEHAGAPTRLVQTTTVTTYPTVAGSYFACTPLDVGGVQTEGSAGSTATRNGTLLVLNLGTAVPPNGTKLVATFVNHRWVARYDG